MGKKKKKTHTKKTRKRIWVYQVSLQSHKKFQLLEEELIELLDQRMTFPMKSKDSKRTN